MGQMISFWDLLRELQSKGVVFLQSHLRKIICQHAYDIFFGYMVYICGIPWNISNNNKTDSLRLLFLQCSFEQLNPLRSACYFSPPPHARKIHNLRYKRVSCNRVMAFTAYGLHFTNLMINFRFSHLLARFNDQNQATRIIPDQAAVVLIFNEE